MMPAMLLCCKVDCATIKVIFINVIFILSHQISRGIAGGEATSRRKHSMPSRLLPAPHIATVRRTSPAECPRSDLPSAPLRSESVLRVEAGIGIESHRPTPSLRRCQEWGQDVSANCWLGPL